MREGVVEKRQSGSTNKNRANCSEAVGLNNRGDRNIEVEVVVEEVVVVVVVVFVVFPFFYASFGADVTVQHTCLAKHHDACI